MASSSSCRPLDPSAQDFIPSSSASASAAAAADSGHGVISPSSSSSFPSALPNPLLITSSSSSSPSSSSDTSAGGVLSEVDVQGGTAVGCGGGDRIAPMCRASSSPSSSSSKMVLDPSAMAGPSSSRGVISIASTLPQLQLQLQQHQPLPPLPHPSHYMRFVSPTPALAMANGQSLPPHHVNSLGVLSPHHIYGPPPTATLMAGSDQWEGAAVPYHGAPVLSAPALFSVVTAPPIAPTSRFYTYSLQPPTAPSTHLQAGIPLLLPSSSPSSAPYTISAYNSASGPAVVSSGLVASSPSQALIPYHYHPPPASPAALPRPPTRTSAGPFYFRDRMSRALQLVGLPPEIQSTELVRELSVWGEVRALQMEKQSEGLVTVHFYDIRAARSALTDIQHQHLRKQQRIQRQLVWQKHNHIGQEEGESLKAASGSVVVDGGGGGGGGGSDDDPIAISSAEIIAVGAFDDGEELASAHNVEAGGCKGLIGGKAIWAHYTIPVDLQTEDCMNQGTLVVFNLEMSMEADEVREIFERYGPVKEVREAPLRKQHKFVEFFDVRDAAAALEALDGTELDGKKLKIEFSRPVGHARKLPSSHQMSSHINEHSPTTASSSLLVPIPHSVNDVNNNCNSDIDSNSYAVSCGPAIASSGQQINVPGTPCPSYYNSWLWPHPLADQGSCMGLSSYSHPNQYNAVQHPYTPPWISSPGGSSSGSLYTYHHHGHGGGASHDHLQFQLPLLLPSASIHFNNSNHQFGYGGTGSHFCTENTEVGGNVHPSLYYSKGLRSSSMCADQQQQQYPHVLLPFRTPFLLGSSEVNDSFSAGPSTWVDGSASTTAPASTLIHAPVMQKNNRHQHSRNSNAPWNPTPCNNNNAPSGKKPCARDNGDEEEVHPGGANHQRRFTKKASINRSNNNSVDTTISTITAASSSSSSLSSWRSTSAILRSKPSAASHSGSASTAPASVAPEQFKFDEAEALQANTPTDLASEEGMPSSNPPLPPPSKSGRTTLMIRNIPNKYTQQMLIVMLDDHCLECNTQLLAARKAEKTADKSFEEPLSGFDFVYLPIDFKNRCNLGYAFVNLTTPQATIRLHRAFHGRQWDEFNSRKICEVTYARLQGREALEDHFKNSRFACDTDEYLPVVFSPPRLGINGEKRRSDGAGAAAAIDEPNSPADDAVDNGEPAVREVSEPATLGGHAMGISSPSGTALGRRLHGSYHRYAGILLPNHQPRSFSSS